MGIFTWSMNRMAGGARTGVVTLEANTTGGISNEIAKYTRKGYVLQGSVTTGAMYGGNRHKYYATMMLAAPSEPTSQVDVATDPASGNDGVDDELKQIELEKKKLELEQAKFELEKKRQEMEESKSPEQLQRDKDEAKRLLLEQQCQIEADNKIKAERNEAKVKLAAGLFMGPLGLISKTNRKNMQESVEKLMGKK